MIVAFFDSEKEKKKESTIKKRRKKLYILALLKDAAQNPLKLIVCLCKAFNLACLHSYQEH